MTSWLAVDRFIFLCESRGSTGRLNRKSSLRIILVILLLQFSTLAVHTAINGVWRCFSVLYTSGLGREHVRAWIASPKGWGMYNCSAWAIGWTTIYTTHCISPNLYEGSKPGVFSVHVMPERGRQSEGKRRRLRRGLGRERGWWRVSTGGRIWSCASCAKGVTFLRTWASLGCAGYTSSVREEKKKRDEGPFRANNPSSNKPEFTVSRVFSPILFIPFYICVYTSSPVEKNPPRPPEFANPLDSSTSLENSTVLSDKNASNKEGPP